ncbi:hypothetical protein [Altericroceibacterium xinjiangense]|uniref:hypothetical protein n=1 Tax=Altericroceibacterium xinjiangense TaxID=762261 RepID=UPI000F7F84D6|nr:hypothetical protein [Altericroceibacterium xinjiangense]
MSAPIKLPPILGFIMGVPVAPREAVERTIQAAIDALDAIDGDPDLEPDGDEADGSGAEDEPCAWFLTMDRGPGCTTADPDNDQDERLFPEYPLDQTAGAFPIEDADDRQLMRPHRDRIRQASCRTLEREDVCGRKYRLEGGDR